MFNMGALFPGMGGGAYEANYRAYPVAFIEKESAETGDKVILPPSALEKLASMHVEYPMLFRVENKREGRASHCGVLEFISQEGVCYMPHWMMQNLLLREGDLVNLKNVSLPKGTFVKIQPHTSDFLEISNPKAVLETSMRGFTCLTQGDTFVINYNGRKYHIDAIEVKPRGAVSVVETDLSVDFAPPKDYVEPDYKALAAAVPAAAAAEAQGMDTDQASTSAPAVPDEPEVPTFLAFGGSGNRLDGKAAAPSNPVAVPIAQLMRKPGDPLRTPAEAPAAPKPPATAGQKAGKVVFGNEGLAASNRLAARLANKAGGAPAPPEAGAPPAAEAPSSFSAFAGKARSLKD